MLACRFASISEQAQICFVFVAAAESPTRRPRRVRPRPPRQASTTKCPLSPDFLTSPILNSHNFEDFGQCINEIGHIVTQRPVGGILRIQSGGIVGISGNETGSIPQARHVWGSCTPAVPASPRRSWPVSPLELGHAADLACRRASFPRPNRQGFEPEDRTM